MFEIDVDSWDRKEHFFFFQNRESPRLAVTAHVSVSNVLRCRSEEAHARRFTDYLYFATMKVVHEIKEFRYRLVGRRPVEFPRIDAGFTYMPTGRCLHANCHAVFKERFEDFGKEIDAARRQADAAPTLSPKGSEGQGLVYLSCIRTIAFTSLTNPWGDPWEDSVPRIIFGKYCPDTYLMPVSVEVLHSFIDGIHLGMFFERLQSVLDEPELFSSQG